MLSEGDPCYELRRRFIRSFLDVVILHMLSSEPLWGYRMMNVLNAKFGIKVGPPVIYPLLDSMEADGLIEGEEVYEGKRRRNMYSATRKGIETVRCLEKILADFVK
jgi:DNA-binding PadR family transcriptional regulator